MVKALLRNKGIIAQVLSDNEQFDIANLRPREWQMLSGLETVLEVFQTVTNRHEYADTPTLSPKPPTLHSCMYDPSNC